ncbi:MAG: ankyrin repeat domain-containing protein [Candidatus Hydrogenedentota bacterium]
MRSRACVSLVLFASVAVAQDLPAPQGFANARSGQTIFQATKAGDEKIVKQYLDQGVDIHQRDARNNSLIWLAVESDDPVVLEMILAAGANPNDPKGRYEVRPLHETAYDSKLSMTQALLDHRADVNAADFDGFTPLLRAASNNQPETVKLLLQSGSYPLAKNKGLETLLHIASLRQSLPISQLAIDAGVDVNAKGPSLMTALQIVAASDRLDLVQLLLDHAADATAPDTNGVTPLHAAAQSGSVAVVRAIIKAGAELNARTLNDETPLLLAARAGSLEAARALIDAGADLTLEDNEGHTPLLTALRQSRMEIVDLLVGLESDHTTNSAGVTPLMAAAGEGSIEVVRLLLEKGSSPTRLSLDRGWNALHYAISRNDAPTTRLLIENGADIAIRTRIGMTPLQLAVELDAADALRELVMAGAQVNEVQTRTGWTPMFSAVSRGDKHTVQALFELGADVGPVDVLGRNVLHIAALRDRSEIAALLIAHGADVRIADANGDTPLHAAANVNAASVAEALTAAGVDVAARNAEGKSAIDIARGKGFSLLADQLERHIDPGPRLRRELLASVCRSVVEDGDVDVLRMGSVTPRELTDAGQYLLHQVSETDNVATLHALLKAGFKVSTRDAEGLQPLHHAAGAGAAAATRALLRVKAAPNDQKNLAKYAPLHFAAASGNEETARALLDAGADPSLRNAIGQTPADTARLANHPELVAVLESGIEALASTKSR